MQANPRSIDTLFNSQLRYIVPMFQRLYVWGEPRWSTLWDDIAEKAELQIQGESSSPHYLGAVIVEGVRPSSPREVKRFLIIDGQQRLTTLQLVICAFRDIARNNGWKTLDRASTRYIENADTDVMEHPGEEQFKLWPTTLNREVFRKIVLAQSREAVETEFPLVRIGRRKKYEPRNALVDAYVYFSGVITAWITEAAGRTGRTAEDCAFLLLQAIQQDFSVVEIALSEGDDSQEIFYSLNSQGVPLSQSDLLRSLIFMRAEKEKANRDEIFAEYWSKFETWFWSTEIKRGGRTYSRLDLGLRYFLMAKTGTLVDARRVNEAYRNWIAVQPPRYPTVRDELADFSKHADVYQAYETPPSSPLPSTDLKRVLRDLDVSTALPLIMYLEVDAGLTPAQAAECLSVLESFIVRRALIGEETKEYNKLFVEVIGALRGSHADQVSAVLCEKLASGGGTTRSWPTDADIVETAVSRPLGSDLRGPALRLVLERLELSLRGPKSESAVIGEGLQIEHVLPQSWASHWPLQGHVIPLTVMWYPVQATGELAGLSDAVRARNAAVQKLGNLTLLNQYLNPAASNGSLELKLQEYRHSVLRLNRYFDTLQVWDEAAIRERGTMLGERLCKIWPRPGVPSVTAVSPAASRPAAVATA